MAMTWNRTYTTLAKSPLTHHGRLKPVSNNSVSYPWRLAIGRSLYSAINHSCQCLPPAQRLESRTSNDVPMTWLARLPTQLQLRSSTDRASPKPLSRSVHVAFARGAQLLDSYVRSQADPRNRTMNIITEAQHAELLANGRAARDAADAGQPFDPKPVVKLFTPHWYARWLLTEIDPEYPQCAYGLCD
jgi:hypothetical protein